MKNTTFKNLENGMCLSNWVGISKYAFIICIVIGFNTENCFAQSQKSEFSFTAGGIFSSLDYHLKMGNINHQAGADFGLRYAYGLSKQWSLALGIDYQSFASTAVLKELKGSYPTSDYENEEFEFRYTATQLREEQRASLITIPLTIQYETSGSERFYIAAGAKIGLPITATYQTRITSLDASGYYAQYDVELFGPEFAGFGNFRRVESSKEDLDLKIAYILTVETGIKQILSKTTSVYLGVYFDYGLNDIYDGEVNGNTPIVVYDKNIPSTFTYNSLFETGEATDLKVIAFGVKIRYAFGF